MFTICRVPEGSLYLLGQVPAYYSVGQLRIANPGILAVEDKERITWKAFV
jgi:hypothetical protein